MKRLNIRWQLVAYEIIIFTVIYIFLTKYNKKETKNLLSITLYSNITAALLLVVMNYFIPAITETISINMKGTFEYNYKILILYPIIILISQFVTIKLFSLLKELQDNVIVSIILTYIITGLLYTVVFYAIAYIDLLPVKYSLFLGISTYILGLVITIIHIIFINFLYKKKVIK